MNEDQLQNKAEILANIHSQIGNAYLELGKYNDSLKHHEEDLKISKEKYLSLSIFLILCKNICCVRKYNLYVLCLQWFGRCQIKSPG